MKYTILFLFPLFLCSGCKINSYCKKGCNKYKKFIKKEWQFNENSNTYRFRSYPEYWYESKYIIDECLVGRNKKFIVKLFGEPSKVFKKGAVNYITYCLNGKCLDAHGGNRIDFFLDVNDNVISLGVSPIRRQRPTF